MEQFAGTSAPTTLPNQAEVAPAPSHAVPAIRTAAPMRVWEPFAVFFATMLVLAALAPRLMTYLNPVTGDEPFYLMTAISMWRDHDINECNNYRQHDEMAFYPAFYDPWIGFPEGWVGWTGSPYPLPPHPAHLVPAARACVSTDPAVPLPSDGTGNELYSKHGLGLSLLVLPPFVIGGRELTVYFLAVLGALLAANVYLLARESTRELWPAVLTWLAFTFTVPQLPYSFLIFPELPAALFVLYAFRRIRLWNNNWFQVAAIGACIAFIPWLHYRFIPVSAALFVYYVYKSLKQRTPLRWVNYAIVGAEVVVSAGLLMAFFYQRYHQILPNAADHAGSSDVAGTLRGAAGLFFDVQWGLFSAAPVYILAFVGVILMAAMKKWRGDLFWIALVFVPYFGVIANYAQWWGEWCPPARYLASVLPLLALPFAVGLERIRNVGYYAVFGVLGALSLLATWGYMYQPQWMYNQPDGRSQLFLIGLPKLLEHLPQSLSTLVTPEDVNGFFPSLVRPYFAYLQLGTEQGDVWSAEAWHATVGPALTVAAIIALCLALAYLSRKRYRDFDQGVGVATAPAEVGAVPATEALPATADVVAPVSYQPADASIATSPLPNPPAVE